MAKIYQLPLQLPGSQDVFPNFKYMVTGDTIEQMVVPGYLNSNNLEGNLVTAKDILHALYNYNLVSGVGHYASFSVTVVGNLITLFLIESDGGVTLPTTPNHIATYVNDEGDLSEDPATAISGGNIQAGLSGTAGTLASFPATASKGSLVVQAVANTGNTITTISNDAMDQATTVNIPDPGNAIAQFLVGATATPFIAGNFPQNSGTEGLMVDSGIPVSSLLTTTDAVLLNPAGDQIIVAYDLSVGNGTFTASGVIQSTTGNIVAGSNGTGATLFSYPEDIDSGLLGLFATNNPGDNVLTISNAPHGQSSDYTFSDCGNASGVFLNAGGSTPFVSGNFPECSGTSGLMVDSGIAVSDLITDISGCVLLAPAANQTISAYSLIVSGGSLTAGSSGTAGTLTSFPSAASKGSFIFAGVANTGNTSTTLSNAAMGQASVVSIPDPGNAVGTLMIGATATPFVSGNFPEASGTGGLMVDSGFSPSDLIVTNGTTTMQSGSYLTFASGSATLSADACTINQQVMNVTTGALTTTQYSDYNFTVNNSFSISGRPVLATVSVGEGTNTTHGIVVSATGAAGQLSCTITNLNTASLNGTVVVNLLLL